MAKPGDVIAGYPLGQPLGQGALGKVFAAEHPRSGRRVAVRVLASVVVPVPEVADKILAGLRAMNDLPLPAALTYLDFGKTPDGEVFIISDFLNGEPLPEHIARTGPLMAEEATALTLQVAATLAVAESRKVFHHDLKPRKLMILPDPGAPFGKRRVVLRDLGFPRSGPELLTTKLDVLRLGGCLYLMLTGRPPALSLREAMADLAQARPGLPALLSSLLGLMLTADDSVRPTMGQAVERLRALLPQASAGGAAAVSSSGQSSGGALGLPPAWSPDEAAGAPAGAAGAKRPAPVGEKAGPLAGPRGVAAGAVLGGAAALLGAYLLFGAGRSMGTLLSKRVLAAPTTLALCQGTVLAAPAAAVNLPPQLAGVALRLNLMYWGGTCFQPAYLGGRDLIYGDEVSFAAGDEPAGLTSQADGKLVISSGAGAAGAGVRLLALEGKGTREVLRPPRLPGFGAAEPVKAGPVAVDGQGAYLFAAGGGGRQALFWARGGALQRLYDLPAAGGAGVAGLQVPAFDAERVYVAAGSQIGRYPLVAGAAPGDPWFLLEGVALRGALALDAQRVVVVLAAEPDRGGDVGDRAVTLLFDRRAQGYYLLAEEDLGPLALRADGALWRYDGDKRALRLLRIEAPR